MTLPFGNFGKKGEFSDQFGHTIFFFILFFFLLAQITRLNSK